MKKRYRKLLLELWTETLLSVGARKVNGKWDLCAGKPEMDSFSAYDEDLVSHAHHEAAHCVLTRLFGGVVWAASLSRGAGRPDSGGCMWSNLFNESDRGAAASRRKITALVAGMIAQVLHDPVAKTEGGSDFLEATAEGWKVVGLLASWKEVDADLERARERAQTLLIQHWGHVEAIAAILLEFHERINRIPFVGLADE